MLRFCWNVAITTIMAEAASTFVFGTPQSTGNTTTVISTEVHFEKTFTITMPHAPCATSSHVHLSSWYPQGMTALLAGPKSIMGTWCHGTMATGNLVILFALTLTPYVHGSHGNKNGALLHLVEGQCGSLPCLPYVGGRELTCAVCTKWSRTGQG